MIVKFSGTLFEGEGRPEVAKTAQCCQPACSNLHQDNLNKIKAMLITKTYHEAPCRGGHS